MSNNFHLKKIIFPEKVSRFYEANRIAPLCNRIFSYLPWLNHFEYHKRYNDGRIVFFSSKQEEMSNIYKEGIYTTLNSIEQLRLLQGAHKRTNIIFTRELTVTDNMPINQKYRYMCMIKMAEEFGIMKRFYIITKYDNHYELACVGNDSVKNVEDFMQHCYNNLHIIYAFIDYFKDAAKKIIDGSKEVILYSPYKLDVKTQPDKIQNHNFSTGMDFYLNNKDYECLDLLSQGGSMKDIANSLQISPRTVEQRINRIKQKSGLNTKSQLVSLSLDRIALI